MKTLWFSGLLGPWPRFLHFLYSRTWRQSAGFKIISHVMYHTHVSGRLPCDLCSWFVTGSRVSAVVFSETLPAFFTIVRMQHVAPSQSKLARLNDNVRHSHEGQRNPLVPLLCLQMHYSTTNRDGFTTEHRLHVHHSCGSVQPNR